MEMNKGQAAITDALYFLLIVMGLVVFLFFFTNQYGSSMKDYMASTYVSDYANSALKTILYSSASRLPNETIDEAKEIEFLMTMVKEDYAIDNDDDGKLDLDFSKPLLTNNVIQIMKPLSKSFNYIFYMINVGSAQKVIYVLAHVTEYDYEIENRVITGISSEEKTYLCELTDGKQDIDVFALSVGASGQATHRIRMLEIYKPPGSNFYELRKLDADTIVGLILWTPKDFDREADEWGNLDCTDVSES